MCSRGRGPIEREDGGFAVSKTDFPMSLCRLPLKAEWFETAVSEEGPDFKPVTVWSPTGKTTSCGI